MLDNLIVLGTGLIILVIIVYIITRTSNKGKKKVDLRRLFRKSNFKKSSIKKIVEKGRKDKEEIIEYESRIQKSEENQYISNSINVYNEPSHEHIKRNQIKAEEEDNGIPKSNLECSQYRFKDIKVESISGVGPSYSARLKRSGITTISELLAATKTPERLQKIHDETGIYTKVLENWRTQADFLRIYGIRKNHIDKLKGAGIESTNQLASISPETLRESILNKHPYSEVPSVGVIKRWIRIAKEINI